MKFLSKALFVFVIFFAQHQINAQNLINMNSWVDGTTGSAAPYSQQGTSSQNSRVTVNGPYGNDEVVWQALADGAQWWNGGFNHSGVLLDTSKSYRFTFWVRSSGSSNCANNFGFTAYRGSDYSLISSTESVDNTQVQWPLFSSHALDNDKWFLVVAYIHPSNYSGGNLGGIYDPTTINSSNPAVLPNAVLPTTDYKFPSDESAVNIRIRTYLYACGSGELEYVYDPTIEEINGQEKSTIELLGGDAATTPPSGGDTVWNSNGSDIDYIAGNVGIGTNALSSYKLAVDGSIRSREVKVDNDNWADYVFATDYKLPTLQEVETHIQEKGHLINIPSADEVKANGIYLGEMNKLLLEKIEELTLYILQQEKRIKLLENHY